MEVAINRPKKLRYTEQSEEELKRQKDTFRVAAIPRHVERAFSKRRQAIEEAAKVHGYKTPKGMELATLRTRRPKRDAKLGELIKLPLGVFDLRLRRHLDGRVCRLRGDAQCQKQGSAQHNCLHRPLRHLREGNRLREAAFRVRP